GEVMRCLKTGCGAGGPTPLAAGQGAPAGVRVSASLPIDFVAGEGGGEAVVVWADAASGDVLSCPADGCGGATPTPLATGRARPRHLVSGNRFFYWIEEGVGGQGGQLFKYEKGAGKAPVPQSEPLATPTRFTLAKDKLFAVDRGTAANQYADGKIVWADPTTDDRDVFVDGQKSLFSIAADDAGGNVYWNADGNLMYCRFDRRCVGGAKLLAAGVGQGDIASDGAYVFFAVGDEIRKVPRP
ncbi:MAG TPA: hypothetical protein VFS00_23220, partial [Polyangiaceae bacterium]|nr:hypothetical protein [Polyangiaceae bacterium]